MKAAGVALARRGVAYKLSGSIAKKPIERARNSKLFRLVADDKLRMVSRRNTEIGARSARPNLESDRNLNNIEVRSFILTGAPNFHRSRQNYEPNIRAGAIGIASIFELLNTSTPHYFPN
jgi:hypothetical protein